MILCFIQGNFSSSPFKAICRPNEAVQPIDQGRPTTRGKDTGPTACPMLAAMLGVTSSQDELSALLPGNQEDTLADRPNHLFFHPRIYMKAVGPRTSKVKAVAYATIEQLNSELAASTTDQEKSEVREERDKLEVLLAFLWASEQGLLTAVTFSGMEESPHLNHQCEFILRKIASRIPPKLDRLWTLLGVSLWLLRA